MKAKTILSVILVIMLTVLSACGSGTPDTVSSTDSEPSEDIQETSRSFSLAYCSTDSLDPYTATTRYNKELCGLLYDSLITVDNSYSPLYRLADSIDLEDRSCTITIKDALFSDGTQVSASDVEYSMKKARASDTKYKTQLENVYSYSATGSKTLEITLKSIDPYFINLLDFPIIKADSDSKTNDDGKQLPPVGSGRYIFGDGALAANENYIGGSLNIKTIELVDTPDAESFDHNLELGNISFSYSDLSDNTPLKMTGKSLSVPLNNLVYLGVNFKNTYLSQPQFRQAVSLALNRNKIVSDCYYNYAQPAAGPYPSGFEDTAGLQTITPTENTNRAVAILSELGYNNKDNDGYLLDSSGNRITLTLLCNLDNNARSQTAQLIKSQLAAAGIFTEIRTVNWNAYLSELNNLSFDLYIGEVKLMNNMDISPLVTEKSGACFGYIKTPAGNNKNDASSSVSNGTSSGDAGSSTDASDNSYITVSAYDMVTAFYKGEASVADVTAAFSAELPVIPLVHRMGQVAYSSDIISGPASTVGDIYSGIENITFS